ncbi:MAG: site-2 protease family protein [Deltaproteobacteria bacterium]|nr:site-2 protease family protein [Deltaproteobacteria bacterium]
MDINTIKEIVVVLVPMILSLTVHEFAHAWSAFKLGDDTAYSMGRMTLNPIAHIDIIGTLVMPIIPVLFGGFSLIGWAKPVPVIPSRFHRNITMRNGMIITALAGPASNLILAFVFGGLVMILFSDPIEALSERMSGGRAGALLALGSAKFINGNATVLNKIGITGLNPALMLLGRIFIMNLGLAVFNMLPVPPLDGSRLLPLEMQQKMQRYTMFVFIGFILLLNSDKDILWIPISFIGNMVLGFWAFFV